MNWNSLSAHSMSKKLAHKIYYTIYYHKCRVFFRLFSLKISGDNFFYTSMVRDIVAPAPPCIYRKSKLIINYLVNFTFL